MHWYTSMHFSRTFYKATAICSMISVITTLLLIFLPILFAPIEGFDDRMARIHEPAYIVRSWAYLLHPFLVLAAALGIAMRIRKVASGAAVIGLLGFTLWAFNEAAQQTLTLFAFDEWRALYATADELTRERIRTSTLIYDGLWDGMYFLLLIGFSIGNLSFGVALLSKRRLTRVTGAFLVAAVLLTSTFMLAELGWNLPSNALGTWAYAAVQPLGRALVGVWLWRFSDELESLDD